MNMNDKSFIEKIDDETLAQMIDKTLNFEKVTKANKTKSVLFKIIPAAAMIALIIGLVNILPTILNDIEIPISDAPPGAQGAHTNIRTALPFEQEDEEEIELFVPCFAEKAFFEERVLAEITDQRTLEKMKAYYALKDPSDPNLTEEEREEMLSEYPFVATAPMYIFDPHASQREINQIYSFFAEYTDLTGSDIIQMYRQYGLDTTENRHTFIEIESSELDVYYGDEYDENGNLVKQSFYSKADGSLLWWIELEYYENGNLVKEISRNADGSINWRQENEYDENGYCTKMIAYSADGSLIRWFEWEYDENGNCIKEALYNEDGSLVRRQDLEYDLDGRLIQGITYDENGVIIGDYYN